MRVQASALPVKVARVYDQWQSSLLGQRRQMGDPAMGRGGGRVDRGVEGQSLICVCVCLFVECVSRL